MGRKPITMKIVRTMALMAAFLTTPIWAVQSYAGGLSPDDFQLKCQVLDPVTRNAIKKASPGQSVLVKASVKVGSAKFGNPVKIVARAKASVVGVNLSANIGDFVLQVPAEAARDELLVNAGGSPAPTEYQNQVEKLFTVPDNFPHVIANVEVVATIPGNAARTCSKSLEVR